MNRIIQSVDGFPLAVTVHEPDAHADSVIIINAATGVPRHFYKDYAHHLSKAGHVVLTYDYRGTGDSRPASLKGFSARMRDWAELDMAGVVEWASSHYRPRRLLLVGHSIGGQAAGLLFNSAKVTAMVTISAQSGYWALVPSPEKYRIWFYVYLLLPMLSSVYGYLPWSRFARGEDLPKGVALEWARWCRYPDYLFGDKTLASLKNFSKFTAPILAYSFSDDAWGSRLAVDTMMARYSRATVERRHRTPRQADGNKIGHLGFFLPPAQALWREVDEWVGSIG